MNKNRLEAFSDGVIAIIITIMVLELRVPAGDSWAALEPIVPSLLAYILSFIYLGIYWNNHHHMLHAAHRVNGAILWANLHLLFWLSLVPFVTGWMGRNHSAAVPTAAYGIVMLCAAIAYAILLHTILSSEGSHSRLAAEVGRDAKGWISTGCYAAAIPLAWVNGGVLSDALYVLVALIWLVPDRRMAAALGD